VGEMKNAYNILVEYSEDQAPLGRRSHRWESYYKGYEIIGVGVCALEVAQPIA
jgi:hypothetical protein